MSSRLYNQMNTSQKPLQNRFSNEQINQMKRIVEMSGMTPKQLFFAKAKEMGVDPNSVLSMLR